MTDDTLRLTYHIEFELKNLQDLRRSTAIAFIDAARALTETRSPSGGFWWFLMHPRAVPQHQARRRWLWAQMHERRADYDCACRAVEALERHDLDSYLLDDVSNFMADAERQRRLAQRDREDENALEPGVVARALLRELREVRDKIDPPVPRAGDRIDARREMNSRRDGAV